MVDYIPHITFYESVSEECLGTADHQTVPRIGERVSLETGVWMVEKIMWIYTQPGSVSWNEGHRGGIVAVMVHQSEGLFPMKAPDPREMA